MANSFFDVPTFNRSEVAPAYLDVSFASPNTSRMQGGGQAALQAIRSLQAKIERINADKERVPRANWLFRDMRVQAQREAAEARGAMRTLQESVVLRESEIQGRDRVRTELVAQLADAQAESVALQQQLDEVDGAATMALGPDEGTRVQAQADAEEKIRREVPPPQHQVAASPSHQRIQQVQTELDEAFGVVRSKLEALSQQVDDVSARSEAAETTDLAATLESVRRQMAEQEALYESIQQREGQVLAEREVALEREREENERLKKEQEDAAQRLGNLESSQMQSQARIMELEREIEEERRLRLTLEDGRRRADDSLRASLSALNQSVASRLSPSPPPPPRPQPTRRDTSVQTKAKPKPAPAWSSRAPVRRGRGRGGKRARGKPPTRPQPPFVPTARSGPSFSVPANVQKLVHVLQTHNAERCETCRHAVERASRREEEEEEEGPVDASVLMESIPPLHTPTHAPTPTEPSGDYAVLGSVIKGLEEELRELQAQYDDLAAQSIEPSLTAGDSTLILEGIRSVATRIEEKRRQVDQLAGYRRSIRRKLLLSPSKPIPHDSRAEVLRLMRHLGFDHDDDRHRAESPEK